MKVFFKSLILKSCQILHCLCQNLTRGQWRLSNNCLFIQHMSSLAASTFSQGLLLLTSVLACLFHLQSLPDPVAILVHKSNL